ncbi:MAG: hypothetical protein R3244_02235 [Thermoanaerobaculia bacterium]|nr:hypothetical protein [Thermoanaerobaculia bacterium]
MAEDVLVIPVLGAEIPKPKPWDFAALLVVVAGVALAGANLSFSHLTEPGATVSTTLTVAFVFLQLTVCCGSLMVLGKTAKEGTIHGNLLALAGMFVGLGGSLFAAALWAIG